MTSDQASPTAPSITAKAVIGLVSYSMLLPGTLFLAAGELNWPQAWAHTALMWLSIVSSRMIALRKHPELLAERGRAADATDAASWDRRLAPIVALIGPLAFAVTAGLDHRYGWPPPVNSDLQWIALVLIAFGNGVAVWAMAVNPFFSAVVRIQHDRGHSPISDGPYRWVRHPAYAGGILSYLAAPLLLDALWALIPAVATSAILVVRTAFEDRELRQRLEGYQAYAAETQSRLIPGIW
jgi:protein-S-isoprenylcysteine O-methyltransferase Ste14